MVDDENKKRQRTNEWMDRWKSEESGKAHTNAHFSPFEKGMKKKRTSWQKPGVVSWLKDAGAIIKHWKGKQILIFVFNSFLFF